MTRGAASRFLFPDPPREFPARRWVRIFLRTGHILAFSALLGGHLWGVGTDRLEAWLYATIASGALLMATELHQSLRWLTELRGVAIVAKLGLLCVIPFYWDARVPILVTVVVISSFVSHMPGRYRYWILGTGPRDRVKKRPDPHE